MANVLIVNIGSTSLKFRLFDMPSEECFASGRINDIGGRTSIELDFRGAGVAGSGVAIPDQKAAIAWLIEALSTHPARPLPSTARLVPLCAPTAPPDRTPVRPDRLARNSFPDVLFKGRGQAARYRLATFQRGG